MFVMKKRLLMFALIGCSIIPTANTQLMPDPVVITVFVYNSGRCAWVTPYWSRPGLGWTSSFIPAAQWVKPGKKGAFSFVFTDAIGTQALAYEVKVRAEFMSNDCEHPVKFDRSGQNNHIQRIKRDENHGMPRKAIFLRTTLNCLGKDCTVDPPEETK
jgi:hypothetical protein